MASVPPKSFLRAVGSKTAARRPPPLFFGPLAGNPIHGSLKRKRGVGEHQKTTDRERGKRFCCPALSSRLGFILLTSRSRLGLRFIWAVPAPGVAAIAATLQEFCGHDHQPIFPIEITPLDSLRPGGFRVLSGLFGFVQHPLNQSAQSGSLWTVSGEKAGRHTAMYSAPSGVLYRTHSPGAVTTA